MNKYSEFIENERRGNTLFLKKNQIYEDRFELGQYEIIRSMWDIVDLIQPMYSIVDDIILKDSKYIDGSRISNIELRQLIVGDFLFGLLSIDLNDPLGLILKTSRHSYVNKIKVREFIINDITGGSINYLKLHQRLLLGLRSINLLTKTEIRIKSDVGKTIIYFEINKNITLDINNMLGGISSTPFVIVELLESKYSVSNFRNIHIVKRKKREMNDAAVDINSVVSANQIGFIISKELYNINNDNIKQQNLLLKTNKFSNYEKYIDSSLSTHKNNVFDLDKIEYTSIIQKILVFELLKHNIFDRCIYLPCFCDNRGRQYYGSILSPTFNHTIRHLIEFNSSRSEFKDIFASRFYNKIYEYAYIILAHYNVDSLQTYILTVLFIEVGKFYVENNNCDDMISTETIIYAGINNYKKLTSTAEYKNLIYITKIYKLIDETLDYKIRYNSIIYKDATSSGLQNYGILLGFKLEKLKYLNIDGNDWCDTYQYLINKFLGTCKYRKRKYWKNTIMTIPYNSVGYTCFIKFLSNLNKDNICYRDLPIEEQKELREIHLKFYLDIKNKIKTEFYKNENPTELRFFPYSKYSVDKVREYKINYRKLRDKYADITYIGEYDPKSTHTALEANNMHYLDAELVKYLMHKYEILTIHDCFGIRLCELHLVMDSINDYYSNIIKKPTYSIHIIK